MTPQDAEALRSLVQSRSGVVINPDNTYQLESALGPIARREGARSIDELIANIRTNRDERLMWVVTEAMTSTETSFFRDAKTFDVFRNVALPSFAGRSERPVRIWSAACAGGQEAYSIAMTVAEEHQKLDGARVELYASDLSEACITKARSGVYTQFEVQRGLPIRKLLGYFEKQDDNWKVRAELSGAVRWRRMNLMSDLSPLGQFDVIFCRNVVSQFDAPTRRRVLEQMDALLGDDGWLVLGAGEDIGGLDGLYRAPEAPGVYSRRDRSQASQAA